MTSSRDPVNRHNDDKSSRFANACDLHIENVGNAAFRYLSHQFTFGKLATFAKVQ